MSDQQWQQPPGEPLGPASQPPAWPVLPTSQPTDRVSGAAPADGNEDGTITDEEFRTWQAQRGNTPRHIPEIAARSIRTGRGEQLRPGRDGRDSFGGSSPVPVSLVVILAVVMVVSGAVNLARGLLVLGTWTQLGAGLVLGLLAAVVLVRRRRRS